MHEAKHAAGVGSARELGTEESNSMQLEKPGFPWFTRVVVPVVVLLAFAGLLTRSWWNAWVEVVPVVAIPVVQLPGTVAALESGVGISAGEAVQAAGWLEPEPYVHQIAALAAGTVETVHFLEGEDVEAGQVMVNLVGRDASLRLAKAQAEWEASEEVWRENVVLKERADRAYWSVRELESDLELAKAELLEKEAVEQEQRNALKRAEALLKEGGISEGSFEVTESGAKSASAQKEQALRRIEVLEARLGGARVEQEAASRQLELRTEEKRQRDLAWVALEEAKLEVERMTIYAPIAGRVMKRMVEPGSRLIVDSDNREMAVVAHLYDPTKLQVRVDVPLADVGKLAEGQVAEVTVEVLPGRTFEGRVTRITSWANIQKNTLEVKVRILDPAMEMRPEMLARVRFQSKTSGADGMGTASGESVFVPSEAVKGEKVWVIREYNGAQGVAEDRKVRFTGVEKEGWKEVAEGLNPGDLVIVESKGELRKGMNVETGGSTTK
ncbi:MAG: efflux RND transporter periplasmic adaptor subunit [Candidatus Sumerlaeia bacterium]|nr:efflux RND transporter periplasmic adaptor subunit [Candidatus Sumerlaeia bacterium]